jgi:uncharacterized protein (DUF433 family)
VHPDRKGRRSLYFTCNTARETGGGTLEEGQALHDWLREHVLHRAIPYDYEQHRPRVATHHGGGQWAGRRPVLCTLTAAAPNERPRSTSRTARRPRLPAVHRRYQPRPKAVGCMPEIYARLRRVYTGTTSMTRLNDIVHSDPEILGGTPVFVGTRVPIQSLFDYLEGGEPLDEFLRQFPSVRRDQAMAALDLARATLLAGARPS